MKDSCCIVGLFFIAEGLPVCPFLIRVNLAFTSVLPVPNIDSPKFSSHNVGVRSFMLQYDRSH